MSTIVNNSKTSSAPATPVHPATSASRDCAAPKSHTAPRGHATPKNQAVLKSHATPTRPTSDKPVIGPSVFIDVAGHQHVPAKIDTGAEASSIWASHIHVDQQGILHFTLFDENSPFYTGEVHSHKDYSVVAVRSAMGQEQLRYRVHLPAQINGRRIRVLFSLSDRSRNSFPVLIGRKTLQSKFLVDVSLPDIAHQLKPKRPPHLKEFQANPHAFHQKYMQKGDSL